MCAQTARQMVLQGMPAANASETVRPDSSASTTWSAQTRL